MKKVLMAAVMLGMTGGAYAAEFGDLAVRASDLKASAKGAAVAPAKIEALSVSDKSYNIRCKYNEPEELKLAQFVLKGTYNVYSKDSATLSYRALINLSDEFTQDPFSQVFAVGENLKNVAYSGVKYKNHFKFPLTWYSVGAEIERGNLIISKEPVNVEKDSYGATIRTFTGALDVSYNDHHGDFVGVTCTERTFDK